MHRLKIIKEDAEHYNVYNEKDEFLGTIEFDQKWDQFVMCIGELKFSSECLEQIFKYCNKL